VKVGHLELIQGGERVVPANAAAGSRRSATSTPSVVSIVESAATLGEQARYSTNGASPQPVEACPQLRWAKGAPA